MSVVVIEKITSGWDNIEGQPGWFQPEDKAGRRLRPVIRCNCGSFCGIGNHHVHPDGLVTQSFFHSKAEMPGGCDWHVHLKLKDYNGGEFSPGAE